MNLLNKIFYLILGLSSLTLIVSVLLFLAYKGADYLNKNNEKN
jgi:uncharacterized membrane protein YuzA (DUF378 family)